MARDAQKRVVRWLTLGSFPAGCVHIDREILSVREFLEDETRAKHGSISVDYACAIHSASVHHGAFKLAIKWLRDNKDASIESQRGLLSDVTKYVELRDKAIGRLKLDAKAKLTLAQFAFDVTPEKTEETPPAVDLSPPPAARWPGIPDQFKLPREE